MRLIRLAFATAIALCLASGLAVAQRQQNQGQNNRQQQRAGAMVQNALDAVSAQSDPLLLIFRKDVQHDLQMDLGQRNRFDNLHDRQALDLQQARTQNRRNRTAVTDLQAKQKKETQAKIDELLTDQQKTRLKQIVLQIQGNAALFSTDLQKRLGMTTDQIQQVKQIKADREQKITQLQADISQGNTTLQEATLQIQDILTEANSSLGELLTDEQADQLKKLQGPPFKAG
ncbi:MAG: hypothetical protein ACHQ50_10925 [Fimbriimonadales bacterium]